MDLKVLDVTPIHSQSVIKKTGGLASPSNILDATATQPVLPKTGGLASPSTILDAMDPADTAAGCSKQATTGYLDSLSTSCAQTTLSVKPDAME
eukprot:1332446-Karenia_brevis.AAC.1